MAGGSYGGSIQLAVAGIDPRVDVIAPSITYNSLITSLYRNGSFRAGMGTLLCHGVFWLGALNNPGSPVKMVWFCGGHGTCNATAPSGPYRTETAVLEWFERYLKGRNVSTGPAFEYVDQDGSTFTSPVYPMPESGRLTASRASGQLWLTSLDRVGDISTSAPAPGSVEIPLPGGASNQQILGAGTDDPPATVNGPGVEGER